MRKLLLYIFFLFYALSPVIAQKYPNISISVDKNNILKSGGEAIVTVKLSKKNNSNNQTQVNVSYSTNGTGSQNYDFKLIPPVYYKGFGKNETSFSFTVKGVYQQYGSSNVNLVISLSNIRNAQLSGSKSVTINISDDNVVDNIAPVFQNPQADISADASGVYCGEIVTYNYPTATDNIEAFSGTLAGYSYLGEYNDHTYYYSNASVTAPVAMQNASDVGGHLLTITSEGENDFINNRVGNIWIGFNDLLNEDTFEWVTGEWSDYTNWSGGEPNDYSSGEDYAEMYSYGTWNDLAGTNSRRYVVEFQAAIVVQTEGLPSGSLFPVGTTTNTFVATDNAGNTATHSFDVTVADVSPPEITRLLANYYDGIGFTDYKETIEIDELNYSWGYGAPESTLVGNDQFSVRFTGSVKAEQAGTYTFYTTSDDGVRLWVDGQLIVDQWNDHGTTIHKGTISLSEAQITPIVLEYYENGGGAVVKLEWEGPGLNKQFVQTNGTGVCKDISVDLSTTGSYILTVDKVDPGYVDACGIASRTLSKTNFTCNDSGDNSVKYTVTDVNGNSSECEINVEITGTPDNTLSLGGDELCFGQEANVTIYGSESGVSYSLYNGSVQLGVAEEGTGTDLIMIIPKTELNLGDNTIRVKAIRGACELNLQNTATVKVNPKPSPKGVYHN
nr:PA14 domain-containing protein [uncultured Marinifilum sp.]